MTVSDPDRVVENVVSRQDPDTLTIVTTPRIFPNPQIAPTRPISQHEPTRSRWDRLIPVGSPASWLVTALPKAAINPTCIHGLGQWEIHRVKACRFDSYFKSRADRAGQPQCHPRRHRHRRSGRLLSGLPRRLQEVAFQAKNRAVYCLISI